MGQSVMNATLVSSASAARAASHASVTTTPTTAIHSLVSLLLLLRCQNTMSQGLHINHSREVKCVEFSDHIRIESAQHCSIPQGGNNSVFLCWSSVCPDHWMCMLYVRGRQTFRHEVPCLYFLDSQCAVSTSSLIMTPHQYKLSFFCTIFFHQDVMIIRLK